LTGQVEVDRMDADVVLVTMVIVSIPESHWRKLHEEKTIRIE
jgi:hypothetical protein